MLEVKHGDIITIPSPLRHYRIVVVQGRPKLVRLAGDPPQGAQVITGPSRSGMSVKVHGQTHRLRFKTTPVA